MNNAVKITNQNNLSKLAIAHNALRKATHKPKWVLEDYVIGDMVAISYYDDNANEPTIDEDIPLSLILAFVAGNYSATVDAFYNGEHEQYVDNRTAYEYFEENTSEVLTDYLNARK
jgi:hypothetical protein